MFTVRLPDSHRALRCVAVVLTVALASVQGAACGDGPSADRAAAGNTDASLRDDTADGAASSNDAQDAPDARRDGATDAANDAAEDASAEASEDAALSDAGPDVVVPPPPAPAVRFIGRFDTSYAAGPKTGFPHAQIQARFSGPEVHVTFADALVYSEYGPTRWEVLIDGASTQILSINRARTTYTLAQGLGAGDHTVELIKLTEANVGISQFMGFEFPGGALLAPPPVAVRHLEFLGDSASNGFGIEGARPCAFSSATENARKAYPALVAADLNADHHNLSASGVGVYWNYTRADPDVVSQIYTRSLPFTGTSVFNFGDYTPDVVWVTLGGNDYSIPNPGDPPPPFASFKAQYDALLSQVRTRRPNAFIVGAVAPSITDDYPQGYSAYTNIRNAVSQVVAAKTLAGDAKIAMFEFTRSVDAADLTGCLSHPNVTKHRALANEAVAFLKTKLGW